MDNQNARLEIARRQLGAALHLYIHHLDSVSVHTLAAASHELVAHSARTVEEAPFSTYVLIANPDKNKKEVRTILSDFFRHFKHATEVNPSKGELDTATKFSQFSDRANCSLLWITWYDYMVTGEPLPIEAQVFQIWSIYINGMENMLPGPFPVFENLAEQSLFNQKIILRSACNMANSDPVYLSDSRTDLRPLLLNAIE